MLVTIAQCTLQTVDLLFETMSFSADQETKIYNITVYYIYVPQMDLSPVAWLRMDLDKIVLSN